MEGQPVRVQSPASCTLGIGDCCDGRQLSAPGRNRKNGPVLRHEPRMQEHGLIRLRKDVGQLSHDLVDDLLLSVGRDVAAGADDHLVIVPLLRLLRLLRVLKGHRVTSVQHISIEDPLAEPVDEHGMRKLDWPVRASRLFDRFDVGGNKIGRSNHKWTLEIGAQFELGQLRQIGMIPAFRRQ